MTNKCPKLNLAATWLDSFKTATKILRDFFHISTELQDVTSRDERCISQFCIHTKLSTTAAVMLKQLVAQASFECQSSRCQDGQSGLAFVLELQGFEHGSDALNNPHDAGMYALEQERSRGYFLWIRAKLGDKGVSDLGDEHVRSAGSASDKAGSFNLVCNELSATDGPDDPHFTGSEAFLFLRNRGSARPPTLQNPRLPSFARAFPCSEEISCLFSLTEQAKQQHSHSRVKSHNL